MKAFLLRNEGFPSFCCVPLCYVYSSEGPKGAVPPVGSVMATAEGRYSDFSACTWERETLKFVFVPAFPC